MQGATANDRNYHIQSGLHDFGSMPFRNPLKSWATLNRFQRDLHGHARATAFVRVFSNIYVYIYIYMCVCVYERQLCWSNISLCQKRVADSANG